ncbi:MAG TPA: hypothetical protein VKA74_14260 [Myxococcota bacterium]|nr:hypothetical protein [Myxococcota bacterium]
MRRIGALTIVLLTLMLGACGGEDVAGTYVLDKAFLRESLREMAEGHADMEGKSAASIDRAVQAMFEQILGSLQVEYVFVSDGTFSMSVSGQIAGQAPEERPLVNGTWELEGDQMTLTLDESAPHPTSGGTQTMQLVDGNLYPDLPDDELPLRLKRKG